MTADPLERVLAGVRPRRAGLVVGAWAGDQLRSWHAGTLPAGADSVFEIGSITKTFTGTLLADMAREGMVALDDPVQRHLPPGVRIPVRGREITLEDLACHRSGLPRLPRGLLVRGLTRDRRDPYAAIDSACLDASVPRTRPRRRPGQRVAYSNYGAGLLGYVLARRAGCSYDELVRRRISDVVGLRDTGTSVDGGRLARGHSRLGREVPHWHCDALAGAGALRSTATDLLRFLRLHAGEPTGPLADAARETHVPRIRRDGVAFGLGWMILAPGRGLSSELLFHDGGTGGFRSVVAVVPERRMGVVVLANQVRGLRRIGLHVLRALG